LCTIGSVQSLLFLLLFETRRDPIKHSITSGRIRAGDGQLGRLAKRPLGLLTSTLA